jgi:hypothetical protein
MASVNAQMFYAAFARLDWEDAHQVPRWAAQTVDLGPLGDIRVDPVRRPRAVPARLRGG